MLQIKLKRISFYEKSVKNHFKYKNVTFLGRLGSYTRKVAQRSIRKRDRASEPGQPPSSHTGILKKLIVFSVDKPNEDVYIGPLKTHQVFFNKHRQPVRGTIPAILEHGGQITILEQFIFGDWERVDLRRRKRSTEKRLRTINIAARPYMRPAFTLAQRNIKQLYPK